MRYCPDALIAPAFLRGPDDGVVSANERAILRRIWSVPDLSRREVTAQMDLAQQSVHRILDALADRGIIRFGPPKPGLGSGQPSPILRLNGDHAWSLGISVNSDVIDLCIIDLAGTVLARDRFAPGGRAMAACLDEVARLLAARRDALRLDPARMFGIGFAIAGFHLGGTRFNATLPLREWSLIELGPMLTQRFGVPVWTFNGGKAGAVAEAMFGIGRQHRDFAYLSFNYGFGGGLIRDGVLMDGGNGNAGEFSQMFDEEETGRRPALQLLLDALGRRGVALPSVAALCEGFDPDWPGVAEWVDEITPAYCRLINAIWAIYDPRAVVFGGEVPPDLARMLIARTRFFGVPRYGALRARPELIVSGIGADVAALGAAVRPFNLCFY